MVAQTNTFLLGHMDRYKVTAAAVVCRLIDGSDRYVYQGARLPLNVSPRNVEDLLGKGMIEEVGQK